jgi:hypothetical protein
MQEIATWDVWCSPLLMDNGEISVCTFFFISLNLAVCADSVEEMELTLTSKWSPFKVEQFYMSSHIAHHSLTSSVDPPLPDHHFVPTPRLHLVRFVMYDPACTPKVARSVGMVRASSLLQIRFSLSGRRGSFQSLDKDEWCALNTIITPRLFPSLDAVQIDSGKSPLVSTSKLEISQWLPDIDSTCRLILG